MPIIKNIFRMMAIVSVFVATLFAGVPAGVCITIQQERELADEFMRVVKSRYQFIDDPVIVDYVNRVGNRILDAIEPQPFVYAFYVIHEDVYNAFATPAGHIFLNSGLFAALESEKELAGIIGHEIAHVTCRHISDSIDNAKKVNMATLAGVAAGVLLGAGGGGEAAGAITMGSLAAGQSAVLAYSRDNEIQADQLGLGYLTAAGYGGEGLLTALKKIRSKQWYGSEQVPTYLTTHPASEARMSYIDNWLHQYRSVPTQPPTGGFDLAHTRLIALYTDDKLALEHFRRILASRPKDPMANYGCALALTRTGQWHQAVVHMQQAIEGNAMAAHMLQDLGRIYFHDGQYQKALEMLMSGSTDDNPQSRLYLGRTQMELGRMEDARETFAELVRNNADYTQAFYYLGESSGRLGDMFAAHYNLGRFYRHKGDRKNASFHLKRAMKLAADHSQEAMVESQLESLKHFKEGQKPGPG